MLLGPCFPYVAASSNLLQVQDGGPRHAVLGPLKKPEKLSIHAYLRFLLTARRIINHGCAITYTNQSALRHDSLLGDMQPYNQLLTSSKNSTAAC